MFISLISPEAIITRQSSSKDKTYKVAVLSIQPDELDSYWTGQMLRSNEKISISYVSPEFESQFYTLEESLSDHIRRSSWLFSLERIAVSEMELPVRVASKPIRLAAVYSLLLTGSLPLDGSVTVSCVVDSNNDLRLVTVRWGGQGWIFRSYPVDFRRVLRKDRQFLTTFTTATSSC